MSIPSLWPSGTGHLNTALMGIPPRPAADAVRAFTEEWARGAASWGGALAHLETARERFARLVGVAPGRIGVGHTVASVNAITAYNLPDGARVLAPEGEHNSNLFPFLNHAHRGVSVQTVPQDGLIEAIRPGVSLVSLSLVQSVDGRVADLPAISAAARAAGALLSVDVTQGAGWLRFDPDLCDVFACASYKWLMAPNGPAFYGLRADLAETFRSPLCSWINEADIGASPYGCARTPAAGARRFDVVPNFAAVIGAAASLDVLLSIGAEAVGAHDLGLARSFCARAGAPFAGSAIVSLPLADARAKLDEAGVAATARDGRVRFAFHLHNDEADVTRALAVIGRA